MPIVRGTLLTADQTPLVGFIDISIDRVVPTGSVGVSLSKSVVMPSTDRITLAAGYFNVELEPTIVTQATYRFQVYEDLGSGNVRLVRDFYTALQDVAVIEYEDLDTVTGIYPDQQDSRFTTIARRLYADSTFFTALIGYLLNARGPYDDLATYRRGDLVAFDGGSYLYTYATNGNTLPTNTVRWFPMGTRGADGTGTTGNTSAVGAGWAGQTDAPARGPLWTFLQTLATKVELGDYISSLSAALITPSIDMGSGQIDTALADSSGVNASWVQDVLDQYRKGFMPVGTMVDYGGTVAPSGWLLCQGQLLLRSAYPDLFTVLGTQYNIGGEAITHFRLPDTRGRVTVSPDTSAGRLTAAAANGSSGGSATVTLSTPNLPSHTHGFDGAGVLTTVEVAPTAGAVIWPVNDPGYYRLRDATEATGSGVPFSVLQPYTTATKMIYTGV